MDESTSGPNRWFVQIEGPTTYCSFEIPSPATIREALIFLVGRPAENPPAGSSAPNDSLLIGKYPNTSVVLIRDDEYTDRYFLLIDSDAALTRLSIAGQDLTDFTEALRQVVEDIEGDD